MRAVELPSYILICFYPVAIAWFHGLQCVEEGWFICGVAFPNIVVECEDSCEGCVDIG
jgi:hypothetical protein